MRAKEAAARASFHSSRARLTRRAPPPPEDWRGKDGHVLPSTLKTAGTLGNSV